MKAIIFGVIGLCLITVIELYALSKGFNGTGIAVSISAIFGIVCGIAGWKIKGIKDHIDYIRGKEL